MKQEKKLIETIQELKFFAENKGLHILSIALSTDWSEGEAGMFPNKILGIRLGIMKCPHCKKIIIEFDKNL